ncbi:MAG: SCO family protein [Ferrimicrobium sp.]
MGLLPGAAREPNDAGVGSAPTARGSGWSWRRALVLLGVLAIGGFALIGLFGGMFFTPTTNVFNGSSTGAVNPNIDPGTPLQGRPAPNFTLTNQFGQPTSLSQFRGKVVVLAFVDSKCTTICPLTTISMLQAVGMLGTHASSVQLVGVDANPIATSVADVSAYSSAHNMTDRWDFLTGTRAQLSAVWHRYNVYVAAIRGNIDHEPAVYVIGPRGGERTLFLTQMAYASATQQAQLLANAVATLLPDHPRTPKPVSLQTIAGIGPRAKLLLPVVGGGTSVHTVQIGTGHPHLFVFFATWLQGTANLSAGLKALNSYATMARQHGWPSLVAIDEATTESSSSALADFLHRMTVHLDYPIVVDSTGRLADGYGVQNLPCTVLTSAAGHIVLTNQNYGGWPPIAGLESAVSQAEVAASRS